MHSFEMKLLNDGLEVSFSKDAKTLSELFACVMDFDPTFRAIITEAVRLDGKHDAEKLTATKDSEFNPQNN